LVLENVSQGLTCTLQAQKSAGYDVGSSIYSLFKDLAAVRAEQRSLQWGKFLPLTFGGQCNIVYLLPCVRVVLYILYGRSLHYAPHSSPGFL